MLRAHADQIARAVLRAAAGRDAGDATLVVGVLGDSVTSGTDNCYYDAWPEALRRQLAPLLGAMGVALEVRNAAKNGGWNLASQFLCAHDMLGAADLGDKGLDFLFITNPFVKATPIDAEHLIRRALLGRPHTVVSMTHQKTDANEEILAAYAGAGFSFATPWLDAPSELLIPTENDKKKNKYKFWFPNQKKAPWGMPDNGFCHLTTRAGSAPIVNRNWHWGPMVHQTYADAYALLLSRAARQAIDDLSSGRMPPEPPEPGDIPQILGNEPYPPGPRAKPNDGDCLSEGGTELEMQVKCSKDPDCTVLLNRDGAAWRACRSVTFDENGSAKTKLKPPHSLGMDENNNPTWRAFLLSDMRSHEAVKGGIGGIRCAIGSANQPSSTLLPHWLHPAEGSPFEDKMKERKGMSFIPSDHDAKDSKFYKVKSPISPPNEAVAVEGWVAPFSLEGFSEEAPRTADQCRHVDGSTMMKIPTMNSVSWLVWKIPSGAVSIGRVMMCHPRGAKHVLAEDAFNKGSVRFHYAVGGKVTEDVHKLQPFGFLNQECTPVVVKMNDADLESARDGGMWVAVEWEQQAVFDFDYLVAM